MTHQEAIDAYVRLCVADVAANPECFKACVVADPTAYALRDIEGFTTQMIQRFTRELQTEIEEAGTGWGL